LTDANALLSGIVTDKVRFCLYCWVLLFFLRYLRGIVFWFVCCFNFVVVDRTFRRE
jgi:hypothetical protein